MRVDLNRIDLNLLVALDALLAERNVTRAAERMSVGQPSMSATLRRLRRVFDDPLLVRDGRGLTTTPFADSLVLPLRRALSGVEAVLATREAFRPGSARRTFSIMATDYVTLIFLQALLSRLHTEAPDVTLNVLPIADDAVERLRSGGIDLLIHPVEGFGVLPSFARVGFFRDRYVVAVDGHGEPEAELGAVMPLEELRARPYLATLVGGRPSFAEQQLDRAGIELRREVVANAVLAPFLLPGTRYASLVPEHLAAYAARTTGLHLFEPPIPLQPVTDAMMWSHRRTNDPGHRWLRRTVQRVVHDFDLINWDWAIGPR